MRIHLRAPKSYRNNRVFYKYGKRKTAGNEIGFRQFCILTKRLFPEVLRELIGLCFGLA